MGTPFYMSPEQCRGEQLDARSDIYSLGIVAYRLLTGETPFKGSPVEVIELHKTAVPPPIREKNRKVPRKMARIAMSALAKNPAERPQSAAGFASALRASWEGPTHLLRQAFRTVQRTLSDIFQDRSFRIRAVHVARHHVPFLRLVHRSDAMVAAATMIFAAVWFLTMAVSLLFTYFFVSAMCW
jgi:serine/threonine protein kinase